MGLTEISAGSSVFIDSNIFVYHFLDQSPECSDFLDRMGRGELQGFTGQVEVLETAHRLMTSEALEQGLPLKRNPALTLSKSPRIVQGLSRYYLAVLRIPEIGIEILRLPEDFLTASQEFRQVHGLLVNDSLVPMHMRQAGLSLLASADQAFDRLPGIERFGPSDI